jgi:hypothetical protein
MSNPRPSTRFQPNSRKQLKLKESSPKCHWTPESDRIVCIGAEMSPEEEAEPLQFLDKDNDVFAWSTSDLIGVSREVIKHKLHVNPNVKPKK